MPQINFKMKYGKNSNLVISPSEILERYFFGISICTANGERLPNETILQKIRAAQTFLSNYLQIKFGKEIVKENPDFIRQEWMGWGFLGTQYPVNNVFQLEGYLNTIKQITYPSDWVSVHSPNEQKLLHRQIHLVPAGTNTPMNNSVVYAGISPHLGFMGMYNIPNYWTICYCSGFDEIPEDLADTIGKIASMQLFAILGDILLGAGIASQSLSFDGLSQSIATTQSAENSAFSARVRQYQGELKKDLPNMKDFYLGINWMAM